MSTKQDKRAKTLLEYMGFKDPDIKSNEHDEWCLRLLDDQIIKQLFYSKQKIRNIIQENYGVIHIIKNGEKIKTISIENNEKYWDNKKIKLPCGCQLRFSITYSDGLHIFYKNERCTYLKNLWDGYAYDENCIKCNDLKEKHDNKYEHFRKLIEQNKTCEWMEYYSFENMKLIDGVELIKEYYKEYRYLEIINISKQLEKVLSNSVNNFRFGFLDVYACVTLREHKFLAYQNETVWHEVDVYGYDKNVLLFFEVKINQPTLGEITREIEYYKDVIKTIYRSDVLPFVISSKKYHLPEQFDCLTFDEFNTFFPEDNQLERFE